MFDRAPNEHTEKVFGPAGNMKPCPFCRSSKVRLSQVRDTFVECADCHAEGPPIRRSQAENPEEAAYRAIQLWRGKDPVPKFEFTERAIADQVRRHEIDLRLIEIMDLVNVEWQSDPSSVQCFDLRIVNEANQLLSDRAKLSVI